MSERNRAGKRSARERLREERERQKAAEGRKRQLKVAGAAIAVLAVFGIVGVFAANADDEPSTAGPAADPIVVGADDAPVTMAVYEDFRCPACAQFETGLGGTVGELIDEGKLRVDYHLVTIIDGNMGGDGSTNAANAAVCAEDAGKFREYHDVLFANQPEERDDAFADKSRLIELAGEVEGLDTPEFRDCVRDGDHDKWVERSNTSFLESDYNSTPTVVLDGENVWGGSEPLTPERLRERVEELA